LSMWASIEYSDTREKYEASELVAPNELILRTRYNATITEKMRIIYAGHAYDILHIAEVNRRSGLKIIAKKKDNTSDVSPYVLLSIGAVIGNNRTGAVKTAGAIVPGIATATYQWQYKNGSVYTNITGATSNTYTPTAFYIGYALRVIATGSGIWSGSVTSADTALLT